MRWNTVSHVIVSPSCQIHFRHAKSPQILSLPENVLLIPAQSRVAQYVRQAQWCKRHCRDSNTISSRVLDNRNQSNQSNYRAQYRVYDPTPSAVKSSLLMLDCRYESQYRYSQERFRRAKWSAVHPDKHANQDRQILALHTLATAPNHLNVYREF